MRLREGVVEAAAFRTHGCATTIAAGSCLAEWVTGLPVAEATAITPEALNDRFGGLPLGREYCAGLAVRALRRALAAASQR